jgi:hypothetical protein
LAVLNSLTDRYRFIFNYKKFRSGTLCGERHNLSLQIGLSANIRRDRPPEYINNRAGILCHLGADMV